MYQIEGYIGLTETCRLLSVSRAMVVDGVSGVVAKVLGSCGVVLHAYRALVGEPCLDWQNRKNNRQNNI